MGPYLKRLADAVSGGDECEREAILHAVCSGVVSLNGDFETDMDEISAALTEINAAYEEEQRLAAAERRRAYETV